MMPLIFEGVIFFSRLYQGDFLASQISWMMNILFSWEI